MNWWSDLPLWVIYLGYRGQDISWNIYENFRVATAPAKMDIALKSHGHVMKRVYFKSHGIFIIPYKIFTSLIFVNYATTKWNSIRYFLIYVILSDSITWLQDLQWPAHLLSNLLTWCGRWPVDSQMSGCPDLKVPSQISLLATCRYCVWNSLS